MISIIDPRELSNVLRPTVYSPSLSDSPGHGDAAASDAAASVAAQSGRRTEQRAGGDPASRSRHSR